MSLKVSTDTPTSPDTCHSSDVLFTALEKLDCCFTYSFLPGMAEIISQPVIPFTPIRALTRQFGKSRSKRGLREINDFN